MCAFGVIAALRIPAGLRKTTLIMLKRPWNRNSLRPVLTVCDTAVGDAFPHDTM